MARRRLRWPEFSERFTPTEQAVAIGAAHGLVMVVVTIIMAVGMTDLPPWEFLVGEAVICFLCASIIGNFEAVADPVGRFSATKKKKMKDALRGWRNERPPVIFAIAFLLQFAALTPLLVQTGGPMNSPFAQLALAFAVFPPILANSPATMVVATASSVLYVGGAVFFLDATSGPPGKGVFVAVTALVLFATVGLAMLDRWEADQRARGLGSGEATGNGDGRPRPKPDIAV